LLPKDDNDGEHGEDEEQEEEEEEEEEEVDEGSAVSNAVEEMDASVARWANEGREASFVLAQGVVSHHVFMRPRPLRSTGPRKISRFWYCKAQGDFQALMLCTTASLT
jgi:hypothetical protein